MLDHYITLYFESRIDPSRPFVDEALIREIEGVATTDLIAIFLAPKWNQYRSEGTAARRGPSTGRRFVIRRVVPFDDSHVGVSLCGFNDGVTYRFVDGVVLNDAVSVEDATATLEMQDSVWRLDTLAVNSSEAVTDPHSPCEEETP